MNSIPRYIMKCFFKKKVSPELLTVFLTNKCNAKCPYCFYADSLNTQQEELSADEWQKIAKSIGPCDFLIMTGGEPFIYNDIAKVAKSFIEYSKIKHINIPTNASFPKKILSTVVTILEETQLKSLSICFSIDGIEGAHDEVRKLPNNFILIRETIKSLHELKNKYGSRLLIHVPIVFSAQSQVYMEKLIEYIKINLMPDSIGLTLVRSPAPAKFTEGLNYSLYRKLNLELANHALTSKYHHLGTSIHRAKVERIFSERSENKFISPCLAGQMSVVIYPNGDVPLCESRKEILGNLKLLNYDLYKILNDKKSFDLVKRQQREKCFCGHECNMSTNIIFNPKELFKAIFTT